MKMRDASSRMALRGGHAARKKVHFAEEEEDMDKDDGSSFEIATIGANDHNVDEALPGGRGFKQEPGPHGRDMSFWRKH